MKLNSYVKRYILGMVLFVAAASLQAQISIPDPQFRTVLSEKYGLSFNENKQIVNQSTADTITVLDISFFFLSDLTGLEAFPNLKIFKCSTVGLVSSINLSGNPKLEYIDCSSNFSLTKIDFLSNPLLKTIYCQNSQIDTLNVGSNLNLEVIDCSNNKLTEISLAENSKLKSLKCSNNKLSLLKISANIMLDEIYCNENKLTGIELPEVNSIKILDCSNNQLGSLDISDLHSLTSLNFSVNNLSNIDLSGLPELQYLDCSWNKLTGLNISSNAKLEFLNCYFNSIKDLNISSNPSMVSFDCSFNSLDSINTESNTELVSLSVHGNKFKKLNLENNTKLVSLDFSNNMVSFADLKHNTSLTQIYAQTNNLDSLVLPENKILKILFLGGNNLKKVNVSGFSELLSLDCNNNKIESLDVSESTKMFSLDCSSNPLYKIEISNNKQLSNINISKCPNLKKCFVWVLPFPPAGVNLNRQSSPVDFSLGIYAKRTEFQKFTERVLSLPKEMKSSVVDSFMAKVPSFPMIEEDSMVTFIFKGIASKVNVPGDANNWDQNGMPMTNLSETDLWYVTASFENDARLDYKLLVNGSNWIFDPLNPLTSPGGLGNNSEMRMPKYVSAPEIIFDPNIPHGEIKTELFKSKIFSNSRTIKIYLPPSYSSAVTDSFPIVIFHDGLEYISLAQANNTLDYLIHNNKIEPVIGIFIPPVDRFNEYVGAKTDMFVSFISTEILPYVFSTYRVKYGPKNCASIGISNGGDISSYLGLKLSSKIGNIGCFSAACNRSNEYAATAKLDLKMYLDAGTHDLPHFLQSNISFVSNVLVSKGYNPTFIINHEGHSWGNWRAHLDNALTIFFPYSGTTSVGEPIINKEAFEISNYPNPFNPNTTIVYNLPKKTEVSLKIFNSLGQLVKAISKGNQDPGIYTINFDGTGLSNGLYFAAIYSKDTQQKMTKLILMK